MEKERVVGQSSIRQTLPALPEFEYVSDRDWIRVYPKGKKTKVLREMIAVIGDRRPTSKEMPLTPHTIFIKNDEGASRELLGIAHGYGWAQRVGLYRSRMVEEKIGEVFKKEFGDGVFLSEFNRRVDFKFWKIDKNKDWYVENNVANFSLAIEVKRLNRHMDEKGPAMANRFNNAQFDLVALLVGSENRWRSQILRSSFARFYVFCEEQGLDSVLDSPVFTSVGKSIVKTGSTLRDLIYSRSTVSLSEKDKDTDGELSA